MNLNLFAETECMDDKDRRKKENDSIVRRMREGDPLQRISSSATWFPPRPLTKKDKRCAEKRTSNVISLSSIAPCCF